MDRMPQKTVLLVEDEAIIALAQAQTVRSFGYRVVSVASGEEALKIAAMKTRSTWC